MLETVILLAAALLPDDAAYLRAIESRSPARCVEIANADRRQLCKVELGDNPANCNTISDSTQRELCRAKAKR